MDERMIGGVAHRLTEEAEGEYLNFSSDYGDGNCSCHISPPCGSCTHPGNPLNLNEDESSWEPAPLSTGFVRALLDATGG